MSEPPIVFMRHGPTPEEMRSLEVTDHEVYSFFTDGGLDPSKSNHPMDPKEEGPAPGQLLLWMPHEHGSVTAYLAASMFIACVGYARPLRLVTTEVGGRVLYGVRMGFYDRPNNARALWSTLVMATDALLLPAKAWINSHEGVDVQRLMMVTLDQLDATLPASLTQTGLLAWTVGPHLDAAKAKASEPR